MIPSQTNGSARPGWLSLILRAFAASASKRFSRSAAGVW